jgi:hypothetical protein
MAPAQIRGRPGLRGAQASHVANIWTRRSIRATRITAAARAPLLRRRAAAASGRRLDGGCTSAPAVRSPHHCYAESGFVHLTPENREKSRSAV